MYGTRVLELSGIRASAIEASGDRATTIETSGVRATTIELSGAGASYDRARRWSVLQVHRPSAALRCSTTASSKDSTELHGCFHPSWRHGCGCTSSPQRTAAHESAGRSKGQSPTRHQPSRAQCRAEAGDEASGVEARAEGRAGAEVDAAGEEEHNFGPSAAQANCRAGQPARLLQQGHVVVSSRRAVRFVRACSHDAPKPLRMCGTPGCTQGDETTATCGTPRWRCGCAGAPGCACGKLMGSGIWG